MVELTGINLNLLVALEALLTEQNVSRAAGRVKLSQSNLSNILKQLREIFDDELLVRGPGNKMLLTYKGRNLIQPVSEAIEKIQDIFADTKLFDPGYANVNFKIGMGDFISSFIIPRIIKELNKYSKISVQVEHLNNITDFEDFKSKNLDFAIGNYTYSGDTLMKEEVFRTDIVCVADKNHPAFQGAESELDVDLFFKYPYLQLCYRADFWRQIDKITLEKAGQKRNIKVEVPHAWVALSMLKGSNLICMMSEKILDNYSGSSDLAVKRTPFKLSESVYSIYWERINNNSPSHEWLKSIVKKTIK